MKATEELLPLDIYCERMQMTKKEIKKASEELYLGSELMRYACSDNLKERKAIPLVSDGGEITQIITESGLIKAIHVYGYGKIADIITDKDNKLWIPELDEFCNLDFEGELW